MDCHFVIVHAVAASENPESRLGIFHVNMRFPFQTSAPP